MKRRANPAPRRRFHLTAVVLLAIGGFGCAGMPRPIKAALTPVTVVRDVVDLPVVTVANVFEYFADHTGIAKAPGAGVGWSWKGGFNWGIGYDLSHFLWKGCSWLFGGADYLVCRSLYPNWPKGKSPWGPAGARWKKLYWPNTRALWSKAPPPPDDRTENRPGEAER